MESKNCSKCGEHKDFSEFNADSRRGDGKRASCKACDALKKKQIREDNMDLYKDRNAANNRALREKKRQEKQQNQED